MFSGKPPETPYPVNRGYAESNLRTSEDYRLLINNLALDSFRFRIYLWYLKGNFTHHIYYGEDATSFSEISSSDRCNSGKQYVFGLPDFNVGKYIFMILSFKVPSWNEL